VLVYTGGSFSGLHEGHRELLAFCRHLSGRGQIVVGLNTDDFIRRYKGSVPLPYATREAALRPLVDLVIPNVGDEDSRRAIDAVQPDIVLIGSDWHARDYLGQLGLDFDWLHERFIVLGYAPRPSGGPSTSGTWA
jgi:cytidyltransferase-like protein